MSLSLQHFESAHDVVDVVPRVLDGAVSTVDDRGLELLVEGGDTVGETCQVLEETQTRLMCVDKTNVLAFKHIIHVKNVCQLANALAHGRELT